MSVYSFPFLDGEPVITITLMPPDPMLAKLSVQRVTFAVDTGFSDYLQVDWETFCVLSLQTYNVKLLLTIPESKQRCQINPVGVECV